MACASWLMNLGFAGGSGNLAGTWRLDAAQVYVPGAVASQIYVPGATAAHVYVPGAVAAEIKPERG